MKCPALYHTSVRMKGENPGVLTPGSVISAKLSFLSTGTDGGGAQPQIPHCYVGDDNSPTLQGFRGD